MLAQIVWGTYNFRKHTTLRNGKKCPEKKCPRVRGGVQSLFGQCPNGGGVKRNGSSLKQFWVIFGPNVSLLFFLLFASLDQSTTATILLAALYNFYNPRLRVGDRFFSPDYIIRANQPLVDDLVKSLLKL